MADDKSPYRPRIKAGAAEATLFVTGLRGLRGHRAQTLERCVRNVEERRAVVTSLKVASTIRTAALFDLMVGAEFERSLT